MKKILIVINHYPISPRLNKLINSIIKIYPQYNLKIIAWNRKNIKKIEGKIDITLHNSNQGYGNKIKKIFGMFGFRKKIKSTIEDYNPDIVHCIDWDTLFLCSTINYKNFNLIYEIYDIPEVKNKVLSNLLKIIEAKLILRVNKIIYASPYFDYRYSEINKMKYTLNNKPSIDILNFSNKEKYEKLKNCLNIAYIGNIRYIEVLKNLVDAITNTEIELTFHGDGPDLNELKTYCKLQGNVTFTGRYDYKSIYELYKTCDVVWAVYPANYENVRLAISNKYFESIAFKKPGIYANNTLLGETVVNERLGFTVDPYSVEDIKKLMKKLQNKKEINNIVENMNRISNDVFWETEEYIVEEIYK